MYGLYEKIWSISRWMDSGYISGNSDHYSCSRLSNAPNASVDTHHFDHECIDTHNQRYTDYYRFEPYKHHAEYYNNYSVHPPAS